MLKIEIKEKKYGSKVVLENISLSILSVGIYGVVGKNGEGKTTFFKCLKKLINFDGAISFNNKPLNQNEIAWCPTEVAIYDELTSLEFNLFYRELLEIENCNLSSFFEVPSDKLIKEFSTGMKKKAYLNAILQKKYSIYIFDEPFNGLDLEANYVLMNYIKNISKGSIVFISSHILETLYSNCDSIFLIQNKKIKQFEKQNFLEIEENLFNSKN